MIEMTVGVVCSVITCAILQVLPSHLLVENVVGFEGSRTRARMVEVMQAAGYAVQVNLLPADCCTSLDTQQHLESQALGVESSSALCLRFSAHIHTDRLSQLGWTVSMHNSREGSHMPACAMS